jgi:hypothetical protein
MVLLAHRFKIRLTTGSAFSSCRGRLSLDRRLGQQISRVALPGVSRATSASIPRRHADTANSAPSSAR